MGRRMGGLRGGFGVREGPRLEDEHQGSCIEPRRTAWRALGSFE